MERKLFTRDSCKGAKRTREFYVPWTNHPFATLAFSSLARSKDIDWVHLPVPLVFNTLKKFTSNNVRIFRAVWNFSTSGWKETAKRIPWGYFRWFTCFRIKERSMGTCLLSCHRKGFIFFPLGIGGCCEVIFHFFRAPWIINFFFHRWSIKL